MIEKAVERYGSQGKFAKRVGVTQQTISKAILNGKVSIELALRLHKATNGFLDRIILCPWLAEVL